MLTNIIILSILLLFINSILSYPLPSYEIFNTYSSIKTNNSSVLLNTSYFNITDCIYITLKSKNKCENFIGFQFFDDIKSIYNSNFENKLYLTAKTKSDNNFINGKNYFIQEFHIYKRKEYLFKEIKGNLLYLEFNCREEVEIINNKYDRRFLYIIMAYIFSVTGLGIILVVIIKGIFCCLITINIIDKKSKKMDRKTVLNNIKEMNDINKNINIIYPNQEIVISQGKIIYVFPEPNLYNNNSIINEGKYVNYENNKIQKTKIQILKYQ